MATREQWFPLLSLFPGILGVGHGGNLFLEFSRLSNITSLTPLQDEQSSLTDDIDDDISQCKAQSVLTPEASNFSSDSQSNNSDSVAVKESTEVVPENGSSLLVIDRDPSGNEKQVEYTLNDQTKTLFKHFESLGIKYSTEIYKPKEMRSAVNKNIFYCKNLFLKDRKGQFFLVICHEDTDIDLKLLRKQLNAYRNFSFGSSEDMANMLNVEAGGVTPLAFMLPTATEVRMVIHSSLAEGDDTCTMLMFHPMDRHLATRISMNSLLRFLWYFKQPVKIVK